MANKFASLSRDDLSKRKAELAAEVQKHANEFQERQKAGGESWPAETRKTWDAVNADLDECSAQLRSVSDNEQVLARIEQIRKDEEQSTRSGHKPGLDDTVPGTGQSFGDAGFDREGAARFSREQADKRNALAAWMLAAEHEDKINDEVRASCQRLGFNPNRRSLEIQPHGDDAIRQLQASYRSMSRAEREAAAAGVQTRALSSVTAGAGPELVPQTFLNVLELAILSVGPFMSLVETLQTASGEDMLWPTADDTANTSVFIGTEGEDTQTIGEPNPVFNRQTWGAHETHSKWIKMPWRLDQDAVVNMVTTLALLIGQRFGRGFNAACTTGTGTGQPQGITIGAPTGHTAAAAAAISFDDLIGLEHSVDPGVRSESYYMMNDNMIKALRLLKDSEGRPLWQPSLVDGQADRVNGHPYAFNQAMAGTIAASAKTIAYGRMSDYKFRRGGNIRIVRAVERFVEKAQDGFLGYWRCDGRLLRPTADARCTVKLLVQAAS